jgi:hypothetical protein
MGYLLDAFQKNRKYACYTRGPTPLLLLAEQIPIIQPLHIHQIMIDQREIGHADDGRYQNVKNRLTHIDLLLNSTEHEGNVNSGVAAILH